MAHISPAHSENINFFGSIDVDIEGELAQLGPTGYRPLRLRDTCSDPDRRDHPADGEGNKVRHQG